MSTSCKHYIFHQRHPHMREAIPTADIRQLTDEELRQILQIRRVPIPVNSPRTKLIQLIRDSEQDPVGGYYGKYWTSPIGISRRIEQLSSNFIFKNINNALKIVAQKQKASWLIWITAADDRVCPICAPRHLKQYRTTWFLPRIPAHPGCFAPDTLVDTARGLIPIRDVITSDLVLTHKNRYRRVRQVHKRWFEGDLYWILGNGLTGNHPLFTPEGWRRADSIQDGDKAVISTLHSYLEQALCNIDSDITPFMTTEQDFFTSIINPFRLGIMPVSPINLYGEFDFWNCKVNVIDFKSILGNDFDLIPLENIVKPVFKVRHDRVDHPSEGLFNFHLSRGTPPFRGFMSCTDLINPLFSRHLSPLENFGLTLVSDRNTRNIESSADCSPSNTIPFSDGVFRHAGLVESDDFEYRQIMFKYHYLTPTITDTYIKPYKGFVHNLTVADDESYAVGRDRLLAHNCRCQWEIVWEDWATYPAELKGEKGIQRAIDRRLPRRPRVTP